MENKIIGKRAIAALMAKHNTNNPFEALARELVEIIDMKKKEKK